MTHHTKHGALVNVASRDQRERSCPSMRWKFGVELERPSVRRPEVELL